MCHISLKETQIYKSEYLTSHIEVSLWVGSKSYSYIHCSLSKLNTSYVDIRDEQIVAHTAQDFCSKA